MKYVLETDICVFEIRKQGDRWLLFADNECYGEANDPASLADNVASWATGNPDWDTAFILVSGSLGDWQRIP